MIVALLGFGTVGAGVFDLLLKQPDITVKYVLDLKPHDDLGVICTSSFDDILNDDEVETIIEVIGGIHPAYDFVHAALENGRNIISANKMMISTYYRELTALAVEHHVALRYTAAAGGGIPWLVNLERAARVAKINEVSGIMNGTSNYILDAMHTNSSLFADALKDAQDLGYAERDPSADIDGIDTLCKVVLSANIAFSAEIDKNEVSVAGIRDIDESDISACEFENRVCKLIGFAYRLEDSLAVFVEPTFVRRDLPEAAVRKNLNLITFDAEYTGRESFYGFGAGRYPTAYTVVNDCIDIANGVKKAYNNTVNHFHIENSKISHRYYVRTAFRNEWFSKIKKTQLGNGYLLPAVSVAEMHNFLKQAKDVNEPCFIAGYED